MADSKGKPRQLLTPKVPPHSEEAEMSVLGGMMLDTRGVFEVMAQVGEADFYYEKHRIIFKALCALANQSRPCDFVTVSDYLRNLGKLDDVEGMPYLGQLVNDTPGAANVAEYARIVRERAALRGLIAVGDRITEMAFRPEGKAVSEIIDTAQVLTSALGAASANDDPVLLGSLVQSWITGQEKRAKRGTGGLSFGLAGLDEATGGMEPGDLIIVAGRPAMGKTAFGLGIANHVSRNGGTVLGFSMEMPRAQWMTRLVADEGGVPMNRLKCPWQLDDIDNLNISRALGDLGGRRFLIDDSSALTIRQLRAKARRAHVRQPLSMILIDYVQLMSGEGKKKDEFRSQEIDTITRGLKALAKELSCPIVALSQVNRGVEARPNKRPGMADIRESGGFENDADLIIGLYRDEVYNEETPHKGVAEAILLKQRSGPLSTVEMEYQGQFFRFTDWHGMSKNERSPTGRSAAKAGFASMVKGRLPTPDHSEPFRPEDYQ